MRSKSRVIKFIVFVAICTLFTGIIYRNYALTTLEKKIDTHKNWREKYGDPPEWCPPAENENLSVFCGTTLTAKQAINENGNYMPNMPLEGVTVEIYEDNPISPTGEIKGQLTHLFSSTSTNKDGRFAITTRKVGPPNLKVYMLFRCGGEDKLPTPYVIETWHDYWDVNIQLDCFRKEYSYVESKAAKVSYINRGDLLGCIFEPLSVSATGMEKHEQPTISNIVQEKNFDTRHAKNKYNMEFWGIPLINFSNTGGLWEPDCLLRPADTKNLTGEPYQCGSTAYTCIWETTPTQFGDQILCGPDPAHSTTMMYQDRITRPFFSFIPKTAFAEPYRRLDIRANLEDFMEDPHLPLLVTGRLHGTVVADPQMSPWYFQRSYGQDDSKDNYIDCEELALRNVPYTDPSLINAARRNKFVNGGPLGGLATASDDGEDIYNKVVYCDPAVDDPTNPKYCILRSPTDPVCNSYELNRYWNPVTKTGNPIRFCDIQPTVGPNRYCQIGDADCGGPCGTAESFNKYVLDRTYFSSETMFKTGVSYTNMRSNVTNDSMPNIEVARATAFNPFSTESEHPFLTQSKSGIRQEDFQKGNSAMTSESIINIQNYVAGTESMDGPLSSPFTEDKSDYEDLAVWKMWVIGNAKPMCSLGNPYNRQIKLEDEKKADFWPDQKFDGNAYQLSHETVSTATYYMGEEAMDRDKELKYTHTTTERFIPYGLAIEEPFFSFALNTGIGRDVWDSLLSMLEGDSKLHAEGGSFHISLTDVLQVVSLSLDNPNLISTESIYKTFGDRTAQLNKYIPAAKPYYQTKYPLNEHNFAPTIAQDETAYRATPNKLIKSPYTSSLAVFQLPTTNPSIDKDGKVCMPDDWTNTTDFPALCYPFKTPILEGEKCNTYRELPNPDYDKTSRTCRVDECKAFQKVRTAPCVCIFTPILGTLCAVLPESVSIVNSDCSNENRVTCAQEQETTLRRHHTDRESGDTTSNDPDALYKYELVGGDNPHYNPSYEPPPIDITKCVPTLFTDEQWAACTSFPCMQTDQLSETGPTKTRCNVTRAGPMIGNLGDAAGEVCNGGVEIGDFAIRLEQRPPVAIGLTPAPPQIELDKTRTASLKLNAAFHSPVGAPLVGGSYLDILDSDNTNTPEGPPKTLERGYFTYGAKIETMGYGDYGGTAQYATAPVSRDKTIPLEDMYYHCNTNGTYTPILRGEVNTKMYNSYDPDEDGTNGWTCEILSPPIEDWAELTHTAGSCSIMGTGLTKCLLDENVAACGNQDRIPNTLSPYFINALNEAANVTGVPAAAIITIMWSEGGFSNSLPIWSDDFKMVMWSLPWYGRYDAGGSAQCNENPLPAQSPFQILKPYFDEDKLSPSFIKVVDTVQKGRGKIASRCNLLDDLVWVGYNFAEIAGKNCSSSFDMRAAANAYAGGSYDASALNCIVAMFNNCMGN